jgi:hypothetical protein
MAKCDVLTIAQNLPDELIDVRQPMAAFFLRVFLVCVGATGLMRRRNKRISPVVENAKRSRNGSLCEKPGCR